MVKDYNFLYSKTMDYAYERIENQDFKRQVKNLKLNDEYNTVLNFLRDNGIEIRI